MAIKRVQTREPRSLTPEQKVAFGLLLFLGFGGIILGFRSFGVTISRPFDLQIVGYLKGEKFLTSTERETAELEASKTRDTDQDGLTDYDELYVYKTSPYLADSDSDSFDDKTEIFSNNNPNCPAGSTCEDIEQKEEATENTTVSGLVDAFGSAASVLSGSDLDLKNPEDVKTFFQKATISEIRTALLKAGVSQEELDQIDDEAIVQFFAKTLESVQKEGGFNIAE